MTSKRRSFTHQKPELIPVDGILISDKTAIDYSFVVKLISLLKLR
jgi:hypothetical protein